MGKVLCTSPHPEISNQIHPFHSFTLKAPRWDGIFLYFQHPQIYQSKTAAKRSLAMIIATVSTLQGFIAPSFMVLLSKKQPTDDEERYDFKLKVHFLSTSMNL